MSTKQKEEPHLLQEKLERTKKALEIAMDGLERFARDESDGVRFEANETLDAIKQELGQ